MSLKSLHNRNMTFLVSIQTEIFTHVWITTLSLGRGLYLKESCFPQQWTMMPPSGQSWEAQALGRGSSVRVFGLDCHGPASPPAIHAGDRRRRTWQSEICVMVILSVVGKSWSWSMKLRHRYRLTSECSLCSGNSHEKRSKNRRTMGRVSERSH